LATAFAACAIGIAVTLFPFDSDGAFAIHDGIWMGMGAEGADPEASISPHHPLFHVLAIALARLLAALGVAHPGHVAIRILAGLGGAWLLVQVLRLSGAARPWAGAGFALVLLCSRGFVMEAASGENVLPAAAAALFALRLAARPGGGIARVAAATALALLIRQDNVFVVPGIAWAVLAGSPTGTRLRRGAAVLAVAGIATLAGYAAAWLLVTGGRSGPIAWLLPFGAKSWSGPASIELARFATYFHSITLAMTGELDPGRVARPLVGLSYPAALVVAGWLLRGDAPRLGLVAPIAATLVGRAFFHTWFEADNFEWLVPQVALVAAAASGAANGRPAMARVPRSAGAVVLAGLAAWLLASHGPWTPGLRRRGLMEAVEEAVRADRTEWQVVAFGERVPTALILLGIPHESVGRGETIEAAFARIGAARRVRPTIVVADRIVEDGMPFRFRHPETLARKLDSDPAPPGVDLLRRNGLVYGARLPKIEDPAPATR
jgi:hypothetical protein